MEDLEQHSSVSSKVWKCCGSDSSKSLIQYIVSHVFLGSIFIYSAVALANNVNVQFNTGLLSLVVGVVIPNPKLKN